MLALILAAQMLATLPQVPDPAKTPGAVNPKASLVMICQRGYTSQPGVRHVAEATKAAVFKAYGIDPQGPGAPFEIDHLISLELGGSNDAKNLWPQSYVTQPYNAHVKDALENRLHALVCKGQITLYQAQTGISTAWIATFKVYVQGQGR